MQITDYRLQTTVVASESMIPHLFRCPISLDLFTDPVTLCTGITYDRPSIERWLAGGNLTCPVTMQRLRDATVVPNRTLRHLIDQWIVSILHSVAANHHRDQATKLSVLLDRLRALAEDSDTARTSLSSLGLFPLLLRLLLDGDPWWQEENLAALLGCVVVLAESGVSMAEHLNMLREDEKMEAFVGLLEGGGGAAVKNGLCGVISAAAESAATRELCVELGRNGKVLRVLVALLGGEETVREAAKALAGLCVSSPARKTAVEEGAVEALIGHLSRSERGCSEAAAALEQLAKVEAGREALARSAEGVKVIVRMVFRVSPAGEDVGCEHAVGCLWAVCVGSGKARAAARQAGALPQLLLLLQSQSGGRAKGKARALLKLLTS